MMFPESVENETIQKLPLLRFPGKVHVIDDARMLEDALKICRDAKFIGFDTEKKPTFQKGQYHPTALVQLSTLEEAFLFRINQIGFLPSLVKLFSSEKIIKVGISILDDIRALQKIAYFEPKGFVEINEVAGEIGIRDKGVRKLAAIFLSSRISKTQQTSNWENPELTGAQCSYAATDAWVCAAIYEELDRRGYLY